MRSEPSRLVVRALTPTATRSEHGTVAFLSPPYAIFVIPADFAAYHELKLISFRVFDGPTLTASVKLRTPHRGMHCAPCIVHRLARQDVAEE